MFNSLNANVMKFSYFVGLDVAKLTFDATILDIEKKEVAYSQFNNNGKGVLEMLKWVRSFMIPLSQTLFCAEKMGTYVSEIAKLSIKKKFKLALACALSVKRSMGLTRGKNDKIDSLRIAVFAYNNNQSLPIYAPAPQSVEQLSSWMTIRAHLIKEKVSTQLIIRSFNENKLLDADVQARFMERKLRDIKAQIKIAEQKIKEIIKSDQSIQRNYDLLTSIVGVGFIVAVTMIIKTQNFTCFSSHRQFACYCGVAPFEHSSGTSVRGKTRISKLANKEVKALINRSALSAKMHDPQMRKYYLRKTAEGKHPRSVDNAIRAKIIARCFAVVKRGTPYVTLQN